MSDLYVLQNHLGLIKIGRSHAVAARRRAIERTYACTTQLVAACAGMGDREPNLHARLQRGRMIGEWFDGTAQVRRTIAKVLKLPPDTVWPFQLADDDAIESWCVSVAEIMWCRTRDRKLAELSRSIERPLADQTPEGRRHADAAIFIADWRSLADHFRPPNLGHSFTDGDIRGLLNDTLCVMFLHSCHNHSASCNLLGAIPVGGPLVLRP